MAKRDGRRASTLKSIILTGLCTYAAYHIKATSDEMALLKGFFILFAVGGAWQTLTDFPHNVSNWLLRRRARTPTNNHGSSGWATDKQLKKAGLFKTDGIFLGLSANSGKPLFAQATHGLTLAMAGAWKTVCFVIPNLLLWPSSVVVTDPKGTLACVTVWARQHIHKQKVFILNPSGRYKNILGQSARFNPLQCVVTKIENRNYSDAISCAKGLAEQYLPEPKQGGRENEFFRIESRSLLEFCFLYVAFYSDKKNLTTVCKLFQNELELKDALYHTSTSDVLNGGLADRANEVLQQVDSADSRQWQSFRIGALQVIKDYAAGTDLSEISSESDFSGHDLKHKKTTVYEICSPTKTAAHGKYFGVVNWILMQDMMEMEDVGEKVLFLFEEALTSPIHGICKSLTILREYGIIVWFVLQDLEAFAHVYGRENMDTMLSQTDCKQTFNIQSQKTAEWVSKSLGTKTVKQASYNLGSDRSDPVQESLSEIARPILTSREVTEFEDIITQYRTLPPIHALKCGYHEIVPLWKWARPNPMHGKKRFKGKIKLWLKY